MPDIKIDLPEERIAELGRFAAAHGKTVNQYILDAINFAVAVDKQTVKEPFAPPVGKWCPENCKQRGKVLPAIEVGKAPKRAYGESGYPWCFEYGCEITDRDEKNGQYRKCEKCLITSLKP